MTREAFEGRARGLLGRHLSEVVASGMTDDAVTRRLVASRVTPALVGPSSVVAGGDAEIASALRARVTTRWIQEANR